MVYGYVKKQPLTRSFFVFIILDVNYFSLITFFAMKPAPESTPVM